MLNWNKVMTYIKHNLSLPSTFIEHADKDMQDYVKNFTIPDFSNYYPDIHRTGISCGADKHRVANFPETRYYFFDDENLSIYGIKECYFPAESLLIGGHPLMGPMSLEGAKGWSLAVLQSRFTHAFSDFNYAYKYIPPNIVEITNQIKPRELAVEYMREQPHDLRKVPPAMERFFLDLCLADVQIWIGNLRSHYGDGRISLPFGPELNLNGDRLKEEGRTLRENTIQRITELYIPPLIIAVM